MRFRRLRRGSGDRRVAAALLVVTCAIGSLGIVAAPASATTVGQTNALLGECGEGYRAVQHTTGGPPSYTVPFEGVVTSFTTVGTPTAPTRLLLLEPVSGNVYKVAEKSEYGAFPTPGLHTSETQISAKAGQRIGVYGTICVFAASFAGDAVGFDTGPDPELGSNQTFPVGGTPLRLNVSAVVEPDADQDGFGDETQDACAGQAGATGGCPPETTITSGPKDKTRSKFATFGFSSNAPDSSFQCAVDGQVLKVPCTSPYSVKVKKGKHTFQVRAIDQTGSVDGSPATDDWKVKKKKK
jgi:hypothetical protein